MTREGTESISSSTEPISDDAEQKSRRSLVVLGAVLALILGLQLARAVHTNRVEATDFRTYYVATVECSAGRDPYVSSREHLTFIYPPFFLWFFSPIAGISFPAAVLVWTLLNFLAWIVVVWLTLELVSPSGMRSWIVVVFPSLVTYRWILQNSNRGQINMIVLLVILALLLAARRHRNRTAGTLLALGVHLKVLPIFFVPFLALQRRWSVLVWSGVAAVVLCVLPAATQGLSRTAFLHQAWLARITQHGSEIHLDSEGGNQSVSACLYRFLGRRDVPPHDHIPEQIAALAPETVWTLFAAFAAIVLVASFLALLRPRESCTWTLDPALVLLCTHLASKKTFEHHLVTHIFVYTAVFKILQTERLPPRVTRFAWLGLALVIALENFYSPLFLGSKLSNKIAAYSPTTAALVVLWVVCLVLRMTPVQVENDCSISSAA